MFWDKLQLFVEYCALELKEEECSLILFCSPYAAADTQYMLFCFPLLSHYSMCPY